MSAFFSFEGPEGSGKSTQSRRLKSALEENGYDVVLTREPGGTQIGDAVRKILLNPDHESMTALTELFLYEANRNQHVEELIRPALKEGKIVLSDRFSDASLVYQGIARDLDYETVRKLNNLATHSLKPDKTFILDVEAQEGLHRAREDSDKHNSQGDRIERENERFHQSVRDGYRKLAEEEPERCVLLPRSQSIESIHESILQEVNVYLNNANK